MTSSNRPGDASSTDPARPHDEHVVLRPGSSGSAPARDDERTVISNRPPLPPDSGGSPIAGDPGTLKPGDMVGHYKILDYVGGGGMGRVFRAQDTQLDREVALKVLPREQAIDSEAILRFRNEARSGARLDHENVARVYHVGEDQGFPYLVFEFVEGPTIRALVEERGPLLLSEAVSYTLQVADALAHANELDVVHRDIKPSNIIVTSQGRVKVIDLGLARIRHVEDADSDLTASGVTLGTFDYISPEQARDPRLVDARSDIYSLGCAFFYMLAGRPPFPEGTVLQKLLQHQGDKPPDIHEFRPELPGEVSLVLGKMLAKDPKDRYETPAELVEQLQALAELIGLRPVGSSRRLWVAPSKPRVPFFQRHLPWIAPVAALLCIVLALDVMWHLPSVGNTVAPPLEPNGQSTNRVVEDDTGPPEEPASATMGTSSRLAAKTQEGNASTASHSKSPRSANGESNNGSGLAAAEPTVSDGSENVSHGLKPSMNQAAMALDNPLLDNSGFPISSNEDSNMPIPIDPALLPEGINQADLRWPPSGLGPAMTRGSGVLTVGANSGDGRDYPNLEAACSAARTGDVIELCYTGRREERPLDLPNAKLTIRAGHGFRPVIVFRPDQDDPVEYPRSMFTLAGGELFLHGVAVEMDIPRQLSGSRWAMWELGPATRLRLEQDSFTIHNPFDHDVAVFRAKGPPALELTGTSETLEPMVPTEIVLNDCIIRGQAVALRVKSPQPVRLTWTNGLLATSEWLLRALGGDREPAPGEAIELQLKHLTARVDKGLCLLDNSRFTLCQLPVKVDCSDSIIAVTSPQGVLVEEFGEYPGNLELPWFTWTGDRNAYHGLSIFMRIEEIGPEPSNEWLEFEQWQERWTGHEIHSRPVKIDFAVPFDPSRPADSWTAAEASLSDTAKNWARGNASDGLDIGAVIGRLPPMRSKPTSTPNTPEKQTPPGPESNGRESTPAANGMPPVHSSRNSLDDTPRLDRTSGPGQFP